MGPIFHSFFLPFYFSLLFLENVLLSLLFTLNWHLRDINTEICPRSIHSLEAQKIINIFLPASL